MGSGKIWTHRSFPSTAAHHAVECSHGSFSLRLSPLNFHSPLQNGSLPYRDRFSPTLMVRLLSFYRIG